MANEFLNRIAQMQNLDMFSKANEAIMVQGKANAVNKATEILGQTEEALARVSGSNELKTIDDRIQELSSSPILTQTSDDIKAMSAKYTELSNLIEKKRGALNEPIEKSMLSLGVLGGDDASRLANEMQRRQGATNKKLDKTLDDFTYQLELDKSMTNLESSKMVLNKYKYDADMKEKLSVASNAILDNELYKALPTITLESASERELADHNKRIANIVKEVAVQTGIDQDTVNDALGSMNAYTKKIRKSGTGKIVEGKKPVDFTQDRAWIDSYKTVQDASRYIELARRPNEDGSETDYDRAVRIYQNGQEEGEVVPKRTQEIIDMFDSKSDYSMAVRQLKAIDPYGTSIETASNAMFEEQINGKMLPPDIGEQINKFKITNDSRYRDLVLENTPGGVLSKDASLPSESVLAISGAIGKYLDDTSGQDNAGVATQSSNFIDARAGSLGFANRRFESEPIRPELTEQQQEIRAYNELVDAGIIPRNIPLENRDLQTVNRALESGTIEDLAVKDAGDLLLDRRVVVPAVKRYFPDAPNSALATIKRADDNQDNLSYASAVSGVDRDLLRAIFSAESNFDNSKVSKAGAVGIGQLMEGAAKDVLPKMKKLYPQESFTVDKIRKNPEYNIVASSLYLEKIQDRLEQSGVEITLENLLRAYNGGVGALKKILSGKKTMSEENEEYPERVQRWNDFYSGIKRRPN